MRQFLIFLVGASVLFLSACSSVVGVSSDVTVMRLPHNMNESHPIHKSLVYFTELVEEKSGGTLQFEIFPNGQLGSEREAIELTQTGAVDATKVSATALESFSPVYALFSIPYVFEGTEHYYEVMESSIATDIYDSTSDSGFFGLTYYDAGTRNMYTINQPILESSDLQGLKIRVQPSETAIEMTRLMGGAPTPMAFGEVYTALQQRVIDGTENNETALTANNHGEVAKDYSYTEHAIVPDLLIFSKQRWDSFSNEEKEIITEAALESTQYHKEIWAEEIEDSTEKAKEMGVTFHEDVNKEAFRELVEPMHERVREDEVMGEYYKRIQDMIGGGGIN
ncbi:TRAP transporter substrate-binding protein [Alkalihalobacillus sp. 1P02AB]|uniref:TRAP transporter substrate-binding protein n=1 Tax=Alkalihalobacillus sp. 1P02AB TaxID=3132260 RepID=UPI0039A666D2